MTIFDIELDTDSDGFFDWIEITTGTDPNDPIDNPKSTTSTPSAEPSTPSTPPEVSITTSKLPVESSTPSIPPEEPSSYYIPGFTNTELVFCFIFFIIKVKIRKKNEAKKF